MKRIRAFLVASALATFTALGTRPAVGADEVLSGNIKEADSKSGQNTNTGAGVKTNHIQNDAVTSAKIKNGTVGAADLANRAVTPAKVSFLRRVIIVDAAGGGNFTSPVAALNSITNATPLNPYLVKVLPGFYDIGAAGIVMKPYVDLEGSGEGITVISGMVGSPIEPPETALVKAADFSEIRDIALYNSSSYGAVGVLIPPGMGMGTVLRRVRVTTSTPAFSFGIYNDSSATPLIHGATVEAFNGYKARGILSESADVVVEDSTVSATGGTDSSVAIETVTGDTTLRRVVATASGSGSNIGVSSINGRPLLESVEAHVSAGAANNAGILIVGYVSGTPAVLRNVRADVTGPSSVGWGNAGIRVAQDDSGMFLPSLETTTAELFDVVVSASASLSMNTGVLVGYGGAPSMTNVTARASGANSRGLLAEGFSTGRCGHRAGHRGPMHA